MRRRLTIMLLAGAVAGFPLTAPAAAQGSYSPYNETATSALSRYVRALSQNPKDFGTLINAGRAALELGDTGAAAGFFARADEVNPRSPAPQAGMGAVYTLQGEAHAALPYFARAQQLGATVASFGADRGLAFDLLGRQTEAQADYRAALGGPDADTARARLALSMAISGKREDALATLVPLLAKRDPAATRARAFILALNGDVGNARAAIDSAMPGSGSAVAPLLARLNTLGPAQKAAAVNLGLFPDSSGGYAYAQADVPQPTPSIAASAPSSVDVASAEPASPPVAVAIAPPPAQPARAIAQAASAAATPRDNRPAESKIWLQLASGDDPEALPSQFNRMKTRNGELFAGISGYVARSPDRARLLIGPFRSASDADTFAADLESVRVNAFKWKNSSNDTIVPLGTN